MANMSKYGRKTGKSQSMSMSDLPDNATTYGPMAKGGKKGGKKSGKKK